MTDATQRLIEAAQDALSIVDEYARQNPCWSCGDLPTYPIGAHATGDFLRTALAAARQEVATQAEPHIDGWPLFSGLPPPKAEQSTGVPVTGDQLRYVARKEIDALLDHIYEYGTTAEGVHARIAAIVNKVESASAKTRGRLGKRVPWGWVYKTADGDLIWHEGCAQPDGPERWYPMYSLDTDEFPVDRQEAAAPEVRAAEPVRGERWYILRRGATVCSEVVIDLVTPSVIGLKKDAWSDIEVIPRDYLTLVERVATAPQPPKETP